MIALQSPQYSSSSKTDLFSKNRSPSFRNKRVPSVQEPFLCHSNHQPKSSKNDNSPSKFSEDMRRRKSQHLDSHNLNHSNGKKKCKVSNNTTRDLMTSIQDLKDQYKTLREAYKELIQEKLKYSEEINTVRQENQRLKMEVDESKNCEKALRNELDAERKRRIQLETDLYFLREKEICQKSLPLKSAQEIHSKLTHKELIEPELQQIDCRSFANSSNILSFSLTSVLQDSIAQQKTSRKREHAKVVSNLSNFNAEFENIELKPKKDNLGNFKKNKKESVKLQLVPQPKESKALSLINPLNQLLSFKSPVSGVSGDKKGFKCVNSSNSKRKREDKENIEPKGCKKKSKKLLQINSPQ